MPDNPLLPNKKLKELHTLMQRCRELDRGLLPPGPAREAMLAAGAIHLHPGDVLCGDPADATACALAPPPLRNKPVTGKSRTAGGEAALPAKVSRLAMCAALARGLQVAGSGGLILALAQAGRDSLNWIEALDYAQRAQAPLIVLCADASGGSLGRSSSKNAAALTWPAICRVAKKLKLPVLPVDGEDAVAVYRVVQECAGRARLGDGPAVVWAVLTPQRAKLGRSAQPLARLEAHLAARGLGKPTQARRVW